MKQDSRIPVLFGQQPGPEDAVLVEEGLAPPAGLYVVRFAATRPGHAIGCACCPPRGAGAEALSHAFRARATGAAPFFKRVMVLASANGAAEITAAVEQDAVSRARYRLD